MKKHGNLQEGNKSPNPDVDSKGKRNVKYPCLICGGDHFTKECPRCEVVNNFLKISPTPTILTDPFPTQQQLIDRQSLHRPSSSIDEVKMISSETINLNTREHSFDPPLEKKPYEFLYDKPSGSNPLQEMVFTLINLFLIQFSAHLRTHFVSPLLILTHMLPNTITL